MDDVADAPVVNGIHTESNTEPVNISNGVQTALTSPKSPSIDTTDAQALVIASLRAQVQDLFSQVTQLNGKLVKSYDRVSDLEDDLHMTSSNLRASSLKVSQLELERTQHLSALNTGLLVEKSNVTTELTRLMEKATEEAAQRGQAESARMAIEKELDDLSASLFDQANTMVAEARYAQSLSERKVDESQSALKTAEEALSSMQKQMQALQDERERSIRRNGAWVDKEPAAMTPTRLLGSHLPYQEFLLFVAHLRSVHSSSQQAPAMSTLLPLPFLARLITEDSDPTVRLDLAPSLNWLSRRSVMSAIHNGQLTVEPVSTNYLLHEATHPSGTTTIPGLNSSGNNILCALCGVPIFPSSITGRPPLHPTQQGGWSSAIFKRPSISSVSVYSTASATSPPVSPQPKATAPLPLPLSEHPSQVYVFRVYSAVSPTMATATANLPSIASISFSTSSTIQQPPIHPQHKHSPSTASSSSTQSLTATTTYPLCTSGWCLYRLRMTCSLWSFIRTGVVEKIWEEEVPNLPSPPPAAQSATATTIINGTERPPIPPRRRGLWGMATALSEKARWGDNGDKNKTKKSPASPQMQKPVPPPRNGVVTSSSSPPPLPRRSEGRGKGMTTPRGSLDETRPPPPPAQDQGVEASTTDQTLPALPRRSEGRGKGLSTPRGSLDETRPPPPDENSTSQPSQIPLPESRPGTPGGGGGEPTRPARSRPISAVIAPPPPIPRRAAKRGGTQNGAASSSRPATPVQEEKEEAVVDAQTASEQPPEEPKEGAPAEAVSNGVVTEEPRAKEEDSPPDTSAVVVAEQSHTEIKEDGSAPGDGKLAEASSDANPGEPTPAEEDKVETDKSEKPVSDDPFQSPTGVNGANVGEEAEKAPEDNDKEVYVGNATWEERTWKELIKLKEEMFWARVGGLR